MRGCYAILVDGGYLKHALGSARIPLDQPMVAQFVQRVGALPPLVDFRLHRVYFYDAKPLDGVISNPVDGSKLDLGKSLSSARNKSLHAALAREPYFSLRFGELSQAGWEIRRQAVITGGKPLAAADIKPSIRQKGVDMRIGLDIASLALKRHVQVIVLVTADSDFIPAMKFARREGAQLILVTLGGRVKEGLREHADIVVEQLP